MNSILRFNGSIVRGSTIRVSRARFGKGGVGVGVREVTKQKNEAETKEGVD